MKRYEKILLGLNTLIFGLFFTNHGSAPLLTISIWLLGISYAVGGFKLFKTPDKTSLIFSIIAGITFGISLFGLPFTFKLRQETAFKLYPIANGIFLLASIIFILLKRTTSPNLFSNLKSLLIRSLVILTVGCFLTYSPITFKPYRKLMMMINQNDPEILNNLQMFDYTITSESALKKGDCDTAIEYGLKATEKGKSWLGIVPREDGSLTKNDSNNLYMIGQTYTNLYEAYKCKAEVLYNQKKYEEALDLYKKGDRCLYADTIKIDYWEIEKSYSLNRIGLCYYSMANYRNADSLYYIALSQYKSIRDTNDVNVSIFLSNIADSYTQQGYYKEANSIYRSVIRILSADSTKEDNATKIFNACLDLAKNHIQKDSFELALFYLTKAKKITRETNENYCTANLYYSACLYAMSKYILADSVAKECLKCNTKLLEANHANIDFNYLLLSKINLATARYKEARDYIDKGMKITIHNNGEESVDYGGYLKVLAHLNMLTGNYQESKNQFNRTLELNNKFLGPTNIKRPELLSEMANLKIILGEFESAKLYSDSSLSMAISFIDLNYPGGTSFLNDVAYVNYCIKQYKTADTLYRKTLRINKTYRLEHTSSNAIALNGLGLIMTEKNKLITADSLFRQSLLLHTEIFGEKHPFTAIVYLNYALLRIKENNLIEAQEMLTQAEKINKDFLTPDHDTFGDIESAFGDIALKEKQNSLACNHYKKAMTIYARKFGDNHYKVRNTINRLQKCK